MGRWFTSSTLAIYKDFHYSWFLHAYSVVFTTFGILQTLNWLPISDNRSPWVESLLEGFTSDESTDCCGCNKVDVQSLKICNGNRQILQYPYTYHIIKSMAHWKSRKDSMKSKEVAPNSTFHNWFEKKEWKIRKEEKYN